jgi:hypothetical protein
MRPNLPVYEIISCGWQSCTCPQPWHRWLSEVCWDEIPVRIPGVNLVVAAFVTAKSRAVPGISTESDTSPIITQIVVI